ncbi:MAG: nitrous oxide reductase accessory protein NosL [Bacteroidetes bacterium]|nr:nitrous oxide reductase accessory protein NosL [Bacteroidota bacterium]MBS1649545.1 nitrous oxide reductase accessory protein NosL [Bacteroidota bacterium]
MLFVKKIFILLAIIFFVSCNSQPEPIIVGKDQCSFCKMMVSDAKFGGEIITTKNKKYKFDDMHCILSSLKSKMIEENEVKDVYITDFSSANHQLINVKTALLLQSNLLKSPMGGNTAAFATEIEMNKIKEEYKATIVSWSQLIK